MGLFEGGVNTVATAVSDAGHVVGTGSTVAGPDHAFSWTKQGGMVDLGTLPGDIQSFAIDVNKRGQVIGQSNSNSGGRPFLGRARTG